MKNIRKVIAGCVLICFVAPIYYHSYRASTSTTAIPTIPTAATIPAVTTTKTTTIPAVTTTLEQQRHQDDIVLGILSATIKKEQEKKERQEKKESEEVSGGDNNNKDNNNKGDDVEEEGDEEEEDDDDDDDDDVCELSEKDFRMASGLHSIVTGLEHSGTTLISQLIMSAPNVFGALECGMLLSETPGEFADVVPFYKWMSNLWKLSDDDKVSLTDAKCHAEMYRRLRNLSPIYKVEQNKDSMVLDKTPRYVYSLDRVMDRTPGVPVVVTVKSDQDQYKSFTKRNHKNEDIEEWIRQSKDMIQKSQQKYPHRIHIVNVTALYADADAVMRGVFDFLDLTWDANYLTMGALNAKTREIGLKEILPFDSNSAANDGRTNRYTGDEVNNKRNKKNRMRNRRY